METFSKYGPFFRFADTRVHEFDNEHANHYQIQTIEFEHWASHSFWCLEKGGLDYVQV